MSVALRKQIGSTLIVVGTEIGAGVLALPILTAKLGFLPSTLIMIFAWALMTYTAILVADINLTMPEGTSFGKMARNLLGKPGEFVSWLSFLLLLYAISVAYISAASSAFHHIIPGVSQNWFAVIFVLVLGFFVLKGVGTVDVFNRFLSTVMLLVLLLVCLTFLGYVYPVNLLTSDIGVGIFVLSLPVIVASFTSHLIIPSLRSYLDSDPKVIFRVLLIGSTIPLVFYLLWEFSVLGVVPLNGPNSFMSNIFSHKAVAAANIGDVLGLLQGKIDATVSEVSMNTFTNLAVITSYLGVSMSLYHFILDGFGLYAASNKVYRVTMGAALTFLLPLAIVLLYPNLFIRALGYVGTCVVVLLIILPVLMARKLDQKGAGFCYKVSAIKWVRWCAMISAILVIGAEFLSHYPSLV